MKVKCIVKVSREETIYSIEVQFFFTGTVYEITKEGISTNTPIKIFFIVLFKNHYIYVKTQNVCI